MFKSLRSILTLFICVSFLSTSTYCDLSPYTSSSASSSTEHLAPSRTIDATLVQWVNGVGMGKVSPIEASSKETILLSGGVGLLAAWFLPQLNLAVIDWSTLLNAFLSYGGAGILLGASIGLLYVLIHSIHKLANAEDDVQDLVDPFRLSVVSSYLFPSVVYLYFFFTGAFSAGSLESYYLLQLFSFVLGIFIGRKIIKRKTSEQITDTIIDYDEDEIEELVEDYDVLENIPHSAIAKLFSRFEARLLPIISRWIVLNLHSKSSLLVQLLKKNETEAEFNHALKVLDLVREIGKDSYELDALEALYAKLKPLVPDDSQPEDIVPSLIVHESEDRYQNAAEMIVASEAVQFPQMGPHLKQMQVVAFEITQDPQLNPEINNVFADSTALIEFLIKLSEDENIFLTFSGKVEEIEIPVPYIDLLTQQFQEYTGGEMPPLIEHFLSVLSLEEEENKEEHAGGGKVKLLEEGAIGNGKPLEMSLEEILIIIKETQIQDEYLKEGQEMINSAFKWMMKRGAHLEHAPREYLTRAVNHFIDTQLPVGRDEKKFLHFFKASDFISSKEDYLIGFNREGHIGLSIDFLFFLKEIFENNIDKEIKFATPNGIRTITFSNELLMALSAEYCFHEFHGESKSQEQSSEEQGEITHLSLYNYVQRDLLEDLFGEFNRLRYFIRLFIDKTHSKNELKIFIGRLSNSYKPEELKDFIRAFNSLRQLVVLMELTPPLSQKEEDLLTFAQKWERVELSSQISPKKIWEFVQNEIDNPNYFREETVESLQFLLGEMIRRLKTQRRAWPQGDLSKSQIVETLDRFINEKVFPIIQDFVPSVGRKPEEEYWRLVSVVNLHLSNSGVEFLDKRDIDIRTLRRAYLRGVDLSKLGIPWEELNQGIDLEGADLREAIFDGMDLQVFKLRGANLVGAKVRRAQILRSQIELEGLNTEELVYSDEEPLDIIEDMLGLQLEQRNILDSSI